MFLLLSNCQKTFDDVVVDSVIVLFAKLRFVFMIPSPPGSF